jgi:hypothetical protein
MNNDTATQWCGIVYIESSEVSMPNVFGAVGKFTDWRALERQAIFSIS